MYIFGSRYFMSFFESYCVVISFHYALSFGVAQAISDTIPAPQD